MIGEKRIDFGDARRQADQIERDAADQPFAVGCGDGARPSFSSRARTKRSIGVLASRLRIATLGSGGDCGATYAQCFLTSVAAEPMPSGHFAPWSIQARIRPICSSRQRIVLERHPFLGAQADDRWISRLSALLPATNSGPDLPPRMTIALASSRSCPCCSSSPWQWLHRSAKIG